MKLAVGRMPERTMSLDSILTIFTTSKQYDQTLNIRIGIVLEPLLTPESSGCGFFAVIKTNFPY